MKFRLVSVVLLAAMLASLATTAFAGDNRNFGAHLTGAEHGNDSLAQGQAIFQLSPDGTELHYRLIVANIENVSAAHIHQASDNVVVAWLYPEAPPGVLIPGRFDGVLAEGTITAADLVGPLAGQPLSTLIALIEAGGTYVNVHTTQFPGGEIRGNIE